MNRHQPRIPQASAVGVCQTCTNHAPEGLLRPLSESWLCPSVGNVNTDPFESIWLKMRQFRPCGGCLGCKRYLTEDTPKMVAARRLLGQSGKGD